MPLLACHLQVWPLPPDSFPPQIPPKPAAGSQPLETLTLAPPSQVLLRSSSPAPAEPVDPNRGLRALTQEEVRGMQVWP